MEEYSRNKIPPVLGRESEGMVVRPKTFTTYLNRCPANCSFFVLDCFVRLPFSCFRFISLTFFASQSLFCDSFCPWFRLTASCRRRHSDGDEPVSDDCQGTPTSLCIMTLERMAIARVRSTSAPLGGTPTTSTFFRPILPRCT